MNNVTIIPEEKNCNSSNWYELAKGSKSEMIQLGCIYTYRHLSAILSKFTETRGSDYVFCKNVSPSLNAFRGNKRQAQRRRIYCSKVNDRLTHHNL